MPNYAQYLLTETQTLLLLLNHYLTNKGCLLLSGIFLFLLILLKLKTPKKNKAIHLIKNNENINAIAGEDVITTQLDLARAYIEMDEKNLAREILEQVLHQGNSIQKHEAKLLMDIK